MKTETEIIHALEELKKSYQIKLKNIDTAITCISTASMIVDAVQRCHDKQVKSKLKSPVVSPAGDVKSQLPVPPPPVTNKMDKQKRTFAEKTCENCGIPYMPTHNKQRFCQKQCNPKVSPKGLYPQHQENDTNEVKADQAPVDPGASVDMAPVGQVASADPAEVLPAAAEKDHKAEELKMKLEKIKKEIPINRNRPEFEHHF